MSPVTTFFRPEHQLSHAGAVGTQVVNVQIGIMSPDGELLAARRGGRDRLPRPAGAQRVPEEPGGDGEPRSRTAGSTPATSAGSTRTACSGSATGTRTSSRPAARTSRPSRWRRRCTPRRRTSPKPSSSGCRTSAGREAITAVVVPKPGATLDPDALLAAMRAHVDAVQDAEVGDRRRRAAQDVDRQDPEERRARAVHRSLRRLTRRSRRRYGRSVDDLDAGRRAGARRRRARRPDAARRA